VSQAARSDPWRLPCLIALFALALGLRWRGLGRSLWYDELFTLVHFGESLSQAWGTQVEANNHPLASTLVWLARSLGAESARGLRLPFWVAGAGAAPALAWALWPSGRRRAWLAGGLLALAPPAVLASQQVRGYAPALLLLALALGAALRLREEAHPRWGALLAGCVVLGLSAHLSAGLGLLCLALLAWGARSPRVLLAWLGGGFLGGLIVLLPTLSRTWKFVRRNLGVAEPALPSPLAPGPFDLARLGEAAGSPLLGFLLVILLGLGLASAKRERSARPIPSLALGAWALTPLLLVVSGALGYARFAWFAWPAWAALAALGPAREPRRLALVVVAWFLALSAWIGARERRGELADLRGAVVLARSQVGQGEVFAAGPGGELLGGYGVSALLPADEGAALEVVAALPRPWAAVIALPAWLELQPRLEAALSAHARYVIPGREGPVLVVVARRDP